MSKAVDQNGRKMKVGDRIKVVKITWDTDQTYFKSDYQLEIGVEGKVNAIVGDNLASIDLNTPVGKQVRTRVLTLYSRHLEIMAK